MVHGSKYELQVKVGEMLRAHRMRQNLTQRMVAERSGVSVNAVKSLEQGTGATLKTFIGVCRTLGKDGWIQELQPSEGLSPIAYAQALKRSQAHHARVRVRLGLRNKS